MSLEALTKAWQNLAAAEETLVSGTQRVLLVCQDGSELTGIAQLRKGGRHNRAGYQGNMQSYLFDPVDILCPRFDGTPTTQQEAIRASDEDYGALPVDEGGLTRLSLVPRCSNNNLYTLSNWFDSWVRVREIRDLP